MIALPNCGNCGKWHPYPDDLCPNPPKPAAAHGCESVQGSVENYHLGINYVGFECYDSKTNTRALICVPLSEAQDFQSRNPTATIVRAYRDQADSGCWAKPFYKSAYGPKVISRVGVGPDGGTTIWRGAPPATHQEEYAAMLRVHRHGKGV